MQSPSKRKEITGHLIPKYINREREARTGKVLETEIDHPVGIE